LLALAEKLGVQGPIPPELFVSKGWRWVTGFVADAATTTLTTALLTTLEAIRTGGKKPTKEQFVGMVVEQLIRNGLLQLILGAVTHENAKARGNVVERVQQKGDREHEYKYDQMHPGPLSDREKYDPKGTGAAVPAQGFYGGKYDEVVLDEDKTFYRVGNAEREWGEWFTDQPLQSEAQYRIDVAVKREWSDPKTGEMPPGSARSQKQLDLWSYTVKIPKGTVVYPGPVGTQGDVFMGGLGIRAATVLHPQGLDADCKRRQSTRQGAVQA
jgi:hypothetical protein